jgi:sn-glycerol 3-phosphate transport system substrate-binding protein
MWRRNRRSALLAGVLFPGVLLASGLALVGGGAPGAGAASLPGCPLSALRSAKGTVDISFWESMVTANATTLQTLTAKFNASQHKVHVTLVQQANYTTTWVKYQSALSSGGGGQLPALVQLTETGLQGVVDTRSVLPAQSCINAAHYPTSGFIPRTLAYYKIKGVQQGMPFAVSVPVVYYNKQSFTAAGLSATSPPVTLNQYVADAKALSDHGVGTGVVVDPWHVRNWLATANQLFVNNANGRSARATKSAFNSKAGLQIFTALNTLVKTDHAETNPYVGPDAYDNLLGIGNGKLGMTIETCAALGTVEKLVKSYPNVTLGVGPLPSVSTRGGVSGGGSALYISNRVPAAQQAAAWSFITFLDSPPSQAVWAAGTGYIPIRTASVGLQPIKSLWASDPNFKVAYDQLTSGRLTPASAGPVVGPYLTVTRAMVAAENDMFLHGASPASALRTASQQVTSTIAGYNQRIGTG